MNICESYGIYGLGERADLIHFDKDRVRHPLVNALLQTFYVRYKEVVSHQLYLFSNPIG